MRVERRLPVSPEAAAQARHALDDLGDLPDGRMRDVRLLVSELVTNAVRHANLATGDVIELVVELADHKLRVEVHDPGGGFVLTFTDVTERHRAAEALERRIEERTRDLKAAKAEAERANQGKTRFLAAAGHDLMQPLHAARLFLSPRTVEHHVASLFARTGTRTRAELARFARTNRVAPTA